MRHLLNIIAIRYVGVILSAMTAFISLRVFLSAEPNNSATFLSFIGWLAFVPLTQLGFGRPCYSEVRDRFVSGSLNFELVDSFIRLFLYQGSFALIGFAFFSVILGAVQNYSGEWTALVVFATGMASIAICTLQKDLSYALSREKAYESLETIRRLAGFIVYVGIWWDVPMQFMGFLALVVGAGSFVFLNLILKRQVQIITSKEQVKDEITHWHQLRPEFDYKARRYFGFSINELLFYNMPLIIFTIFPEPQNIIYFGVWTKIFMLIMLPVRIIIDSKMNNITNLYFSNDYFGAWQVLSHCLLAGILLILPFLTIFYLYNNIILQWLKADLMLNDSWLVISIALWAVGNTIQHTYGTFTISHRNGFGFAYINSLSALFLVGGTFLVSYLCYKDLGLSLAFAGVTYILSAFAYMRHVFLITHKNHNL